jgi:hypothetical protein
VSPDLKGFLTKPSEITYDYATIRITQSRIDKGLLAIPVGLSEWFPGQNQDVHVYLNASPESQAKRYSSYNSSTRECRIGGLKDWFEQNHITSGDEIVIQFLDKAQFIYRLIPEKRFISATKELQLSFDIAGTMEEASNTVRGLASWTLSDENAVSLNEFDRLAGKLLAEGRHYIERKPVRTRESLPANLRILLSRIYQGQCQVCDFWFLKKDGAPFFEVHHLDPAKGHHPKNVVVVCGNCHNQFEYADVQKHFDDGQWLVTVVFNQKAFSVRQALSPTKPLAFTKKVFV